LIVRVAVQDGLPMLARRRERAIGHVNSGASHVLSCRDLRQDFSVRAPIHAIAGAYGIERRIRGGLGIDVRMETGETSSKRNEQEK